MRRTKFHALKRVKLRQTWNKYNLYNLSRADLPNFTQRTFFQQKWTAKATTRSYHGETIREKKWQRIFRPTIRSVVSMDYQKLAGDDGARQAMGRGSGLEPSPSVRQKPFPQTPYMNMIYAPIERRLDTAIFRALFASSTRQARQFVVHGWVKVNGKPMIYPGYQLNPGDMFQVEPERVMYATGAPKDAEERRATRQFRKKESTSSDEASPSEDNESPPPATPAPSTEEAEPEPQTPPSPKTTMKDLLARAKSVLEASRDTLSGKRKKDLRALQSMLKRTLSRPTILTDSIDAQILELTEKLNMNTPPPPASSSPNTPAPDGSSPPASTSVPAPVPISGAAAALGASERALLKAAMAEARENPVDASKPYATPWRPRPFMSAFAFVPRYLEVHHRICSAVYLRHPVARPGLAEVPTPFPSDLNGLAYLWYLRRR